MPKTSTFRVRKSSEPLDFGPPPTPRNSNITELPAIKENTTMSHSTTKLSRSDVLAQAINNTPPTVRNRVSHLNILNEEQWRQISEARKANPKLGLQQLFKSMQDAFLENDEAFFKNYAQFYATYRRASKLLSL